ncbi:hypothetical protein [Photobacterium leiognathi]|uniref:hypothetical protein n=1 Tax=Photobacterium leiognathi TaxID=553611 RepID=UPI00273972B2|nr:hypothetical protein [Photobacterium leiognathi]
MKRLILQKVLIEVLPKFTNPEGKGWLVWLVGLYSADWTPKHTIPPWRSRSYISINRLLLVWGLKIAIYLNEDKLRLIGDAWISHYYLYWGIGKSGFKTMIINVSIMAIH